jgi:hypothetical protein
VPQAACLIWRRCWRPIARDARGDGNPRAAGRAAHESANAGLVCRRLPGGAGGAGGGARNGPLPCGALLRCQGSAFRLRFRQGDLDAPPRARRHRVGDLGISPGRLRQDAGRTRGRSGGAELPRAFNRQSVGRRAFIVAAGPAANFLLAIVLYWFLFMHGVTELKPRLGSPPAGRRRRWRESAKACTVRAVNGKAIETWQELRWEVLRQALDKEDLQLEVISPQREIGRYRLPAIVSISKNWKKIPARCWGWCSTVRACPPWLVAVQPGSAAELAGFREGDRVLSIDGKAIAQWAELAAAARSAAGRVALRGRARRRSARTGWRPRAGRRRAGKNGTTGPDGQGRAGRSSSR